MKQYYFSLVLSLCVLQNTSLSAKPSAIEKPATEAAPSAAEQALSKEKNKELMANVQKSIDSLIESAKAAPNQTEPLKDKFCQNTKDTKSSLICEAVLRHVEKLTPAQLASWLEFFKAAFKATSEQGKVDPATGFLILSEMIDETRTYNELKELDQQEPVDTPAPTSP